MRQEQLKDRLQKILEKRSMPAKHLSLAAGLNETAVRDILIGRSRHPRTDTTRKIARALDIRHEWLVDGYGDPEDNHMANQQQNTEFSDSVSVQKKLGTVISRAETSTSLITIYSEKASQGHEADIITTKPKKQAIPFLSSSVALDLILAVHMPNERMRPRCRAGETLFFRKDILAATGQECLIETSDGYGYIGMLTRLTDETVHITRYHGGEVILSRRQVVHLMPLLSISCE